MIARSAAALAITAAAAACNTAGDVVVIGGLREATSMRALASRDLDLLFVIDSSPSMADKQTALAESFPRMIDKLSQIDGGLPDLHLGVISSDMGTQGSTGAPGPAVGVPGAGGCSGVGDDGALLHPGDPALLDGFVSDIADPAHPGERIRNYAGELRDEVSRLVQLGATGCGFEQHLAALRRSLVNPANAGFFRPAANLAVVILADEDDCSVRDPALFGSDPALGPAQSFRCFEHGVVCDPDAPRAVGDKRGCRPRDGVQLIESVDALAGAVLGGKRDPRQVMVAAIAGDPEPVRVQLEALPGGPVAMLAPSCAFDGPTGGQHADPGVRLAGFLRAFPGRAQLTSICSADLTAPLDAIGATAKRLIGDPCIDTRELADASADPGVQPACDVVDVRDAAPGDPRSLAMCGGDGATDCYAMVADPVACPASDDHLRIVFRRTTAVAPDTWTHVRCQRAP